MTSARVIGELEFDVEVVADDNRTRKHDQCVKNYREFIEKQRTDVFRTRPTNDKGNEIKMPECHPYSEHL